jgi:pilus assembly protein CpaE
VTVLNETTEKEESRIYPIAPITVLRPVSIGAYFERPETQATLELVKGSRHLLRARMTIASGGVSAALRDFGSRQSPQILIIEDLAPTELLLRSLDSLAQVCDTETRLVVIGRQNDVGLYRELTRRGVSEYVPHPLSPAEVTRVLADLTSGPAGLRKGKICACVGASGGSGSSSIAQNLAWLLAADQKGLVALADFDIEFGTVGLRLNCGSGRGIAEAIERHKPIDPENLSGLFAQARDNLKVLASQTQGITQIPDVPAETMDHLFDALRSTADLIVLDLPRPRSDLTRRALAEADTTILVATPDLTGLRNARRLLDLIRGLRPDEPDPLLVLNRVPASGAPQIKARDFGDVLGLKVFTSIPDSPALFHQAENAEKLVVAGRRGKPITQSLRPLVNQITGYAPRSWFGRFKLPRLNRTGR